MKPEQLEIARLKREVTKLKAERDIPKKAAARLRACMRINRSIRPLPPACHAIRSCQVRSLDEAPVRRSIQSIFRAD